MVEAGALRQSLPTVEFNPQHVTDEVRADIAATLRSEDRLSTAWEQIYPQAVLSVEEGRNLVRLANALRGIGWTKAEAGDLARHVHNRATIIMGCTRQLGLGLKEAVWSYSGAGCLTHKNDTKEQISLDAAHKAADGKKFLIAEGLVINGRHTWPGLNRHCKCVSKTVVPGLS